ncbi:MAG: heparan-alpha-glucosaminide N-acetyltransferase domain-containing protein [bacterium]
MANTKAKKTMRLFSLDLARLMAMLMMMQGHTIDALVQPQLMDLNVYPWNIWQFMRGLTAPIFLIVSGTVHVFAMKRNEQGAMSEETRKRRMRWAWVILLWGYMLVFPANRLIDLPFVQPESWSFVFQVNILHLTALTLMAIVWLSTHTYSIRSLGIRSAIISMSIFILAPIVHSVHWFNILPEFFAGFLSSERGSLFPLFPTSGFMFLGVAFGSFLHEMNEEKRSLFMKKQIFLYGGLLIGLGIGIYQATHHIASIMEYLNPGSMIMRIGVIIMFLGACTFLSIPLKRFEHQLVFFSSKSLYIYILHLLLLYGTPWFPSVGRIFMHQASFEVGVVSALLVVTITPGLLALEQYLRLNLKHAHATIRFTLLAMLAYALII